MTQFKQIGTQFDRVRVDLNENFSTVTKVMNNAQAQINKLVVEGDSSPQAAAASVGADGTVHGSLKSRLDAEQNAVTSQLTQTRKQADPIGLNDAGTDLLNAIQGGQGTPVNVLSIPRDKSVTPSKTTFIFQTRNLFNKADVRVGFFPNPSTGAIQASSAHTMNNEPIPIRPSTRMIRNFNGHVVFLNADQGFISGINEVNLPAGSSFMTPDNAGFIILSTKDGINNAQLEEGSVSTPYQPYAFYLSEEYIESYSGEKIKTNSVGLDKVDFIIESRNLFDKYTATSGYLVNPNSGALQQSSSHTASDFIPVTGSSDLVMNFDGHIAFYNANKSYIGGIHMDNHEPGVPYKSPSNTAFERVSVHSGYSLDTAQLELGTSVTDYMKYGVAILDPNKIISGDNQPSNSSSGWSGKEWLGYGDSITAIGNGNGLKLGWQSYVNTLHRFSNFYGRGIGGQSFVWNNKVWFANSNGTYHSRDDAGNAADPSSYTLPSGTTAHFGSFCSWDRITTMIPSSIKDKVDLIFIKGGTNDPYVEGETGTPFITGNKRDDKWGRSNEYTKYNGDYDVTTLRGAIASTILKMQAWCPNAVIVFGTPLSGRGSTGQVGTGLVGNEYEKSQVIKEVCGKFSIPVIDIFATCGINPLNRTTYIDDSVHPYNEEGKKALARSVIGGLNVIAPKIKI